MVSVVVRKTHGHPHLASSLNPSDSEEGTLATEFTEGPGREADVLPRLLAPRTMGCCEGVQGKRGCRTNWLFTFVQTLNPLSLTISLRQGGRHPERWPPEFQCVKEFPGACVKTCPVSTGPESVALTRAQENAR